MNIKKRIYEILEVAQPNDSLSRYYDIFIIFLISANVIALIIGSVHEIYQISPAFFEWFEKISIFIFTIEYILRVWSSTENQKYNSLFVGRIRFIFSPLPLIDLWAFLPFYLPFLGIDLRSIRVIRLLRFFRVAKFARYSNALQIMGKVIKAKKSELVTSMIFLFFLLIISSTLMYFIENEKQPDKFSSIPAAMWWSVATLTTVGYGDVCPVTGLGKIMASIISILGIGMFALPTGILGAGFVEVIQKDKTKAKYCPHCGKFIE